MVEASFGLLMLCVVALIAKLLHRSCIQRVRARFPLLAADSHAAFPASAASLAAHISSAPLAECYSLLGAIAPTAGLIVCLLLTLRYNYAATIAVHGAPCPPPPAVVPQLVPSISATIGDNAPQRYIWRAAVCAMLGARLHDGALQAGFFRQAALSYGALPLLQQEGGGGAGACGGGDGPGTGGGAAAAKPSSAQRWFGRANAIVLGAHTLQQLSLALLSCVSSSDDLALHEVGFVGFIVTDVLHMAATMVLFRWCYGGGGGGGSGGGGGGGGAGGSGGGPAVGWSASARASWVRRRNCMAVNFSALALAGFCYWRHEMYCEPYGAC